ncbi:MAG: ArsR/SmtB family transcription factor [Candidatus Acidulodesulfobacterium sp.]
MGLSEDLIESEEFNEYNSSLDNLRDIFYALSDNIRLEVISMLIDNGEMCVCKFQEIFKISQPNLSFHLGILRKSGLVKTRRKGTWMNYSLNYENEFLKNLILLIKKAK